jgi:hypothetical protein
VCGVPSPLPSLSSTSTSLLSLRRPSFGDGECTQAIEKEKARKAHCQKKKTKQREENCIVIPLRCDENNKNKEEKPQASSRSSIDAEMVVDKIRRPRTEEKNNNKAGKRQKDQKINIGPM